jgi:hypothetical protein
VLLLTSAFDPVDENEVKSCGADGIVAKPFDPGELRKKLRELRDQPPKFPGFEVQGALSGVPVKERSAPSPETVHLGEPELEIDPLVSLLSPEAESEGDADSILASAFGGEPSPVPVPEPESLLATKTSEFTNSTIMIDRPAAQENTPPILDLSQSFATPPGGTSLLNIMPPPETPRPVPPPAAPIPEALSPNAQALAAFFAAEIDSQAPAAPSPIAEPEKADAFDASLASIEWSTPAAADLGEWSSSVPAPSAPAAAPPTPPVAPPSAYSGASSEGGSFLFDTGGSNFRFAENYIDRITKSFTGHQDEMTLGRDPSPPIFQQKSDDRPIAPSPAPSPVTAPHPQSALSGGGAWSSEDVKRIEQLVRDEVQMVVREVAEKVIWEVVPELAENLIKRELDKVLKEMEEEK